MTPEDEIEQLIRQSINNTIDISTQKLDLITFPNIFIRKRESFYSICIGVQIHSKNNETVKKYEELGKKLEARKILIENEILDKSISIMAMYNYKIIPIYYKNCVFTEPNIRIFENCENCIVEGG